MSDTFGEGDPTHQYVAENFMLAIHGNDDQGALMIRFKVQDAEPEFVIPIERPTREQLEALQAVAERMLQILGREGPRQS